jgi:hypothetical protein
MMFMYVCILRLSSTLGFPILVGTKVSIDESELTVTQRMLTKIWGLDKDFVYTELHEMRCFLYTTCVSVVRSTDTMRLAPNRVIEDAADPSTLG